MAIVAPADANLSTPMNKTDRTSRRRKSGESFQRLTAAAAAGLCATAVKTAFLAALHDRLPLRKRHPLAPGEIVAVLERRADWRPSTSLHQTATFAAHFGYGAGAGAIYGRLRNSSRGNPVVRGMAHGMAVWAASYLVLLPAARILKPVTEHDARRTSLMIAGHLVWGASLGVAEDLLSRKKTWKRARSSMAGRPRRYPEQVQQ